MQFTFLDMAGKTLFIRDDAERAQWTQEEYSLDLEFPYIANKAISTGQRVFFIDPATGNHQIYEIKQAKTNEPDHYQTIVAENICVSELSDEHMDAVEVTDQTAKKALQDVLEDTLWSVGTSAVNPVSSGDLSRGSVWQAVLQIKDNWNVYIEPRVTLASDGTITRKLDILSTDGIWNGLRLSVDKNMLDPSVTIDDSEVVTALYGYGGTDPNVPTSEDPPEVTFENVVWQETADHPAKPAGQKYLEDPQATELYGRNGRPRFGYYQNNDITDPDVLLQKTWESLKQNSKPAVSIDGTVSDLYRLGYADEPIRLHDNALVEILPAGFKDTIQIIRLTVDLLDPSATTLTIGAYIPNIIYIERKTNEQATGGRGGGGGNTSSETAWREFVTTINAYKDGTGMEIKAVQNDIEDQSKEIEKNAARIEVTYNRITSEVTARQKADGQLQVTFESRITQTANQILATVTNVQDGLQSEIDQQAAQIALRVKKGNVISEINLEPGTVKINADHIELNGEAVAQSLWAQDLQAASLDTTGNINGADITGEDITANGTISGATVSVPGTLSLGNGNHTPSWKSLAVVTAVGVTYGSIDGTIVAKNVESVKTTIHYVGY